MCNMYLRYVLLCRLAYPIIINKSQNIILNLFYFSFLKVETHVSGVAFNLKESCPLIIGSVPLKARFDDLKSSDLMPSAPPLFTPSGYPDLRKIT